MVLPFVPVMPTTLHRAAGMAVEAPRPARPARRGASSHDDPRAPATLDGAGSSATIASGAPGERLRRRTRAVGLLPSQRHEDRAGRRRARVVGDRLDGARSSVAARGDRRRGPTPASLRSTPRRSRSVIARAAGDARAREDCARARGGTQCPGSSGVPGGGSWSTTTPSPDDARGQAEAASARIASRALRPRTSGTTVRGGPSHGVHARRGRAGTGGRHGCTRPPRAARRAPAARVRRRRDPEVAQGRLGDPLEDRRRHRRRRSSRAARAASR